MSSVLSPGFDKSLDGSFSALIDKAEMARAAEILRRGGLVAFPTETVYGLGADATNAVAVRRIFEIKRRPATSPLIVHVESEEMAREYAAKWPRSASELAERFWPGPLTLVLPKRSIIPDEVTAGLGTVGLRVPAHPVALELIRTAGLALAAPSANRFTQLSPTTAAHVRDGLGDSVDLILDGGSTPVGIESTVVSLAGGLPVLLRPGMISKQELEEVLGDLAEPDPISGAHPSPGMHHRHYSPRTKLLLITPDERPVGGRGVVVSHRPDALDALRMPASPKGYAAALYATLHELDGQGLDWIAIERVPEGGAWAGIRDRLARAAARA